MKSVDLIASGYEWVCPRCKKLNLEIEVTETVKCRMTWKEKQAQDHPPSEDQLDEGCGATFKTEAPEHAYG